MGDALLLTGAPGVGKTTTIRQAARELGVRAGGFYTEEIRRRGSRVGFRLVTLEGATGILAGVNIPGNCRVGRYGVNLHDLDGIGVGALRQALVGQHVEVVVVDEIGKMELYSEAFRTMVLAALESEKLLLGSVMAGPHPWVDALRARPGVTVVEVTTFNRQGMPEQISRWLREVKEARARA
ncbi:MAG: AAA family ATPase [Anaerolineae bacterium]|nr:AAA family ATPase [Anaerolineae bacterium]